MPQKREHPYIWATWLPRLLTGENSCEWAIWFKAHHQNWERVPSDFNQAQWMLNHTALLNERRANWEVGGYRSRSGGTERLSAARPVSNAVWQARHNRASGQRSRHCRREDRPRKPQPRRAGDDLPVRRPKGARTLPERQAQGAGHLPGPHGPYFGREHRRQVHPEPGRAHPSPVIRRTRETGAVTAGMPVLRHYNRRLSGTHRRRFRAGGRRYHRLLKGSRSYGRRASRKTHQGDEHDNGNPSVPS